MNRKREKETYSKMFFPTKEACAQAEQGQSVSEYVEKVKAAKPQQKIRTIEDQEIADEFLKIDLEVQALIEKRKGELSFEVKDELTIYPEIAAIDDMIHQLIDNYKVLRRVG